MYEAFVEFSERLYPSAQISHLCADYPRAPSLDSPIDSIIDPMIDSILDSTLDALIDAILDPILDSNLSLHQRLVLGPELVAPGGRLMRYAIHATNGA